LNSTGTVTCTYNTIGSITGANAATNGTNVYGIYKISDATGTQTISYNTIGSEITANSLYASSISTTALNAQEVVGIYNLGNATLLNIDHNTVGNLTNATTNADEDTLKSWRNSHHQ